MKRPAANNVVKLSDVKREPRMRVLQVVDGQAVHIDCPQMPAIGPNDEWAEMHLPSVRAAAIILIKTPAELQQIGKRDAALLGKALSKTASQLLDMVEAMGDAMKRLKAIPSQSR